MSLKKTMLILLTIFIFGPAAYTQEGLQALQAWWPLEKTSTDATGNGLDGVLIGSPAFDDTDKMEGDFSLVLNGTDQEVQVEYDEFKAEFATRTFAAWFKTTDPTADQVIFEEGGTGRGMAMRVNANKIEARANEGGAALVTSTSFYSTNWTHVAVVFDNGAMSLYVNGLLAEMQDTAGFTAVGGHGDPSTIGGSNWSDVWSGAGNFSGKIDGVKVFTSALTAEEVLSLAVKPKNLNVMKIPEGSVINLDGKPTDFWATLRGFDADQSNEIYNLKNGNDALVEPDDAADLSSSWNLAYNDTALFGFFSVKDETVEQLGDSASWFNDAIEIYLKVGGYDDMQLTGDIGDDCVNGYYQYVFSPEYDETRVFGGANTDCQDIMGTNASWRSDITSDGYNVEFYIKWEGLKDENGVSFTPSDGATLRFEPHIHDHDAEYNVVNPRTRSYWSLDRQPGNIEGGHAWEAGAWQTGNIGIITFNDQELTSPQPKSLSIKKIPAGAEINLDGKPTDFWSFYKGFSADQSNEIYNLKYGNTALVEPEDAEDLSSSWNLAYNDTALFGFFSIKDDVVEQLGDTAAWFNDAIEIYIKAGNYDDTQLSGDIGDDCQNGYYQYVFSPEYDETRVFGLNATCEGIQNGNASWRTDITSDGYNLEFYISWNGLKDENGDAFNPVDGASFRLEPHIHDHDAAYNEVNPRTRAYWSLDGQPGSIEGGHAWEAAAWQTGSIGTIVIDAEELTPPQPKTLTVKKIPANAEISLDGKNNDFWSVTSGYDANQSNEIYNLKYGNTALVAPEDAIDLSSEWNLAYNDTALFGFFSIKDDVVEQLGDTASWFNDAIEIYIKVGDYDDAQLTGDIGDDCQNGYYQYAFAPEYDTTRVFGLNATCEGIQDGNASWRTVVTAEGYDLEFYINWEGLKDENGVAFTPTDGSTIRFEPHVHDHDAAYNEVNPRTRAYWSLDGQPGNIQGGHAWEAAAWQTGTVGILNFSSEELILEDFYFIDGIIESKWDAYTWQPIDRVALGGEFITDADDFSGQMKIRWDQNALYGLFDIKDDVYDISSSTAFLNDYVGFYIDVNNAKHLGRFLEGDYYFRMTIGGGLSGWYGQASGETKYNPPVIPYAMDINEGTGYIVEFAIPWDSVGVTAPAVDNEMGIEVILNDRDVEGERSMLSFMGEADLAWSDPSLWGSMRLEDNGAVTYLNTQLDAPVLAATSSGNTVTASWDAVDNAIGYYLVMDGEVVKDVATTSTTYDVIAAKAKTFDFQLFAYADGKVLSPISNSVTLDIIPAIAAVSDLSGSASGAVVTLSWSAVPDAVGYKILQDGTEIGDTTATDYVVTVSENGLYTFTVVAYNSESVESAESNGALINIIGVNIDVNRIDREYLVYPNPSNDRIWMNVLNAQSVNMISIDGKHIDISGKIQISADKVSVNISDLKPGFYFIRVQDSNTIYHSSFTKE